MTGHDEATGARPPRAWWRRTLGLRALMLLVLGTGGGLGWYTRALTIRREALATIRATGGSIDYRDQRSDATGPWVAIYRRTGLEFCREIEQVHLFESYRWTLGGLATVAGPARAASFAALAQLGPVNTILLDTFEVSPDEWSMLARAHPVYLCIDQRGGPIDERSLEGLGSLRSLRCLKLDARETPLPRSVLSSVDRIGRLEDVGISGIEPTPRWSPGPSGRWGNLTRLELVDSPIDGGFLDRLGAGARMRFLQLRQTQVTDDQLRRLVARHPDLEELELDGSRLTDAGTTALAGLARLKHLRLRARRDAPPRLTDETLVAIGRIAGLTELYVTSGRFTGRGVEALGRTPLERLELGEVESADAATWARFFAAKPRLGRLKLRGPGIDDRALPALLPPRGPVSNLSLSRSAVTDAGMATLATAPLTLLHLNGTALTDAGLDVLGRSATLLVLGVAETRVTPTGLAAFRGAHPKIRVYSERRDEEGLDEDW